jgi:hypothetical protein
MFAGAPLPLSPDVRLSHLLALTRPGDPLGAWVSTCRHRLRIYRVEQPTFRQVLACADLGFLLGRCARVAVREGRHVRVLASQSVIHWRALQVATAIPYLPGVERMRALFPRLYATPGGFRVPLHTESAEEVLARCVSEGLRVTGSVIVYCAATDDSILPVVHPPP